CAEWFSVLDVVPDARVEGARLNDHPINAFQQHDCGWPDLAVLFKRGGSAEMPRRGEGGSLGSGSGRTSCAASRACVPSPAAFLPQSAALLSVPVPVATAGRSGGRSRNRRLSLDCDQTR